MSTSLSLLILMQGLLEIVLTECRPWKGREPMKGGASPLLILKTLLWCLLPDQARLCELEKVGT